MTSLLSYGDQAFSVSNGAKDLLYELAIEVASCGQPAAHQRLSEDGRLLGCYQVSGLGFDLKAFAQAFGGARAWQEATAQNFGAVETLCSTPECVRCMTKVLVWSWFLLNGGRCNDATGRHPDLHELPEVPGEWAAHMAVETPEPALDPGWLYRTPSTKFMFAFGIGFGALVGTFVGIGTMLLGLAQDWRVIPAWVFTGALLGSAHPTVNVILSAINRPHERPVEGTGAHDALGPASAGRGMGST
jgi:hypothetical protein